MPLRFWILIFTLVVSGARAQSHITSRLLDSLQKPIPFCAVALLKSSDSSLVKGNLTDDNGHFSFSGISVGKYLLKADHLGTSFIFPDIISCDSASKIEFAPFIFRNKAKNLDEVTISVIKKPLEFKNGNIIVNVEGSPLAVGNSVYDLLLKLPGVLVVDDNVSIQGNSGVRFYFDDRLQRLAGAQMINLLKSMPASSVQKIEIVKVPPVKYDAAGSAGIINIVTKKAKIVGFSGSVTGAYTQAYYANGNAGLSLNYKGRKINFFSNLNGVDESYKRLNYQDRHITYNNLTTDIFQHYDERQRFTNGGIDLGADWYIDSKNILGVKASGWSGQGHDQRTGYITVNNSDLGYDYYTFGYDRKNPWNYLSTNLNFEHKLDTLGSKILVSADYNYSDDLWTGDYNNLFYDLEGGTNLPSLYFKTDNRLMLNMASAKVDFEKQFWDQWKLDGGAKANYTNMLSDYNFGRLDNNTQVYESDSSFTNTFEYNEVITAGYLNLSKSFKKMSFQAGLRAENTEINTLSHTSNIAYHRAYFNLFPVASIDWTPNDNNSFQISYNRRIDRPGYDVFNPYRMFRNYLVTQTGNPYLKPMYFNSFNFNYNYKGILNNSFSYNMITDVIYEFDIQNDSTKEKTTTFTNFDNRNVFVWDMFVQKNVFKWWITTLNTSLIYFTFNGTLYNQNYKASQYSYNIYNNNQFILPRNFKIEATFAYNAPWLSLISNMQSRWNLDIGIKKNMLKDNLTLGLSCSDIFFTSVFKGSADFANLHQTWRHTNDTRRIKFSVSYNFGKYKVRQRSISSAEESGRMTH